MSNSNLFCLLHKKKKTHAKESTEGTMKSTDLLSQLRFVADGMNGISLPATVRTRVYCFRSNPCVKPSPTPGVTKGWFLSGQWAPLTSMDSTPYLVTAGRFSSFVWGGALITHRSHAVCTAWRAGTGHLVTVHVSRLSLWQWVKAHHGTREPWLTTPELH